MLTLESDSTMWGQRKSSTGGHPAPLQPIVYNIVVAVLNALAYTRLPESASKKLHISQVRCQTS